MADTKTRSAPSANGSAASRTVAKAREAGDSVATAARKSKGPAIAAGATAAGLAGGLALGARMSSKRRRVLGVPVGRKKGMVRTAEALGRMARELRSARGDGLTKDDVKEVREQLEMANRRSPIEVLVDGLTHRRGAHRRES